MMNKKNVLISLALLLVFKIGNACDVCGVAPSNNYIGIMPQFKKHFVGLRYQFSSFNTKHPPSLLLSESNLKDEDKIQKIDLFARIYLSNRFQIITFIPYQINTKTEINQTKSNSNIGDLSVLVNYILFNTGDSNNVSWKNTLSFGLGVKLPTGSFNSNEIAGMQTGSGTFDYLFSGFYTTRYKKIGLNTELNYKLNGTENNNYYFGNKLSASTRFFYWQKYKATSLVPNLGLIAEFSDKDMKNKITEYYSGGKGFYLASGIEIYFKKYAVGLNYFLPCYESLNQDLVSTNQRLNAQFIYLF